MEIKATNTICIQIQSKTRSFAKAALVLLKILELILWGMILS